MAKKSIFAFLMVLVFSSGALGGGLALSGIGSKAIGMGGAFRGLADNWSAAYWNPAGLAQLKETEINLMAVTINPLPEYTPNILYGGYEVGYRNGLARYPQDKTHFAPNVSGFYNFHSPEDFTFGVAVFVPYALGSRWDLFKPYYADAVGEFPKWNHEATLQVLDIHPSLAKAFMDDKLMLGVGVSFMRGKIDFRKTLLNPTSLPRPHDYLAVDAKLHGEGWGYGANFGLLYKLSEKLQFGISGKTPATIKFDGDIKSTLFPIYDNLLKLEAQAQAPTLQDSLLLDYIFSTPQEGERAWANSAAADLKLPADAGIGFAYFASEKLTLTLDLSYTMWSRLDSIVVNINEVTSGDPPPVTDPADTLLAIITKWDNTLRFSAGGQYQLSNPLALRFGLYYDPSPIPDETFSPLFLDVGTKYSLNLGAAVKASGWELGYNFEYIYFSSRDIPDDPAAGSQFDNYPGSSKADLIANHVSVTYRF